MTLREKADGWAIHRLGRVTTKVVAEQSYAHQIAVESYTAGYLAALKDVSKETDAISKDDPMNDVMCMTDELREILKKLGKDDSKQIQVQGVAHYARNYG